MESDMAWHDAFAALDWQLELGADASIGDTPVDRFALEARAAAPVAGPAVDKPAAPAVPAPPPEIDPVAEARRAAAGAGDIAGLRAALAGFEHCEYRKGARNLVFADGTPGARVMIIGDAPGRDEDRAGRPFVGEVGDLLTRMLAAIDLSRDSDVYLSMVLPWYPPRNTELRAAEVDMLVPFLNRHIALAQPEVVVLMGNLPCRAVLGTSGIAQLRGTWAEAAGRAVLPMLHPADLIGNPGAKRDAWADLLRLRARLQQKG